MKRLLLLAALLLSAALSAQNIAVLDKVGDNRVCFDYSYSLSKSGAPMQKVTDGKVTVEGNAFSLTGLGLQVISDGTTRWTVDTSAKEVLIETVENDDIFTNPALLISSYKSYSDKIKVNSSSASSLDVTLVLDEEMKARFVLKNITYLGAGADKKEVFSFDEKTLDKSYIVTDLR